MLEAKVVTGPFTIVGTRCSKCALTFRCNLHTVRLRYITIPVQGWARRGCYTVFARYHAVWLVLPRSSVRDELLLCRLPQNFWPVQNSCLAACVQEQATVCWSRSATPNKE